MQIISVINLKGGVGKTTIALNLAATLADQGHQVVLIDADPQQSATQWAQQGPAAGGAGALPMAVAPLRADDGAPQFQAAQATLVVIDCPPELSDPALVAALLADLVLVPVTPSPLDLWAAKQAVATAQEARTLRDGRTPLISLCPPSSCRRPSWPGTCRPRWRPLGNPWRRRSRSASPSWRPLSSGKRLAPTPRPARPPPSLRRSPSIR